MLTFILWLGITLYWIISAVNISGGHRGSEIFSFIKLIGSALIIYLPLPFGGSFATQLFSPTLLTGLIGISLCLTGIALMAWSRVHLGRNWSGNVIIQQGHKLISNGPYKYIRHPIYSGGLLAMLATAMVVGYIFSFLWVAFCVLGLVMKMREEEKLLSEQFPSEYPLYKKRTKMLVPFVW